MVFYILIVVMFIILHDYKCQEILKRINYLLLYNSKLRLSLIFSSNKHLLEKFNNNYQQKGYFFN